LGLDVLYPFHDRCPVILTGQVSFHNPNGDPLPREGFHATDADLLLIHFTLMWNYYIINDRNVKPYAGLGLSTTTFFMSEEWPPEDYSDESEFGASAVTGIQYEPNSLLRIFADYHYNVVFSSPYILHFGTVRAGVRFALRKRGEKDEA
jgi:outer membrane protein W